MSVSIDLSELEGLADMLRLEGPKVAVVTHAATIATTAQLKAKAKAAAPQDRPWLATSGIFSKTRKDERGSHGDVFTVADERGRPVGVAVEYGWHNTPPQPFLAIQSAWAETAFPAAIEAKVDPLR